MLVNDDYANDVQNGQLVLEMGKGLDAEKVGRVIDWCRKRAQELPTEPWRDPLGGATPALHGEPQCAHFAPAPPALGVKAVAGETGVTLTWKIAPEVTKLTIERQDGKSWKAVGSPGLKDKEFVDGAGQKGAVYRLVASTGERDAKPTLATAE
jgi:hypothetical protein